jgi:CBS domain-containing protein
MQAGSVNEEWTGRTNATSAARGSSDGPKTAQAPMLFPATETGRCTMKVAELMSPKVHLASPGESLRKVAKRMAADGVGFLPVGENDRLVGTITDRDIVVRAVAEGKDGNATVADAMTRDVRYCFDDEEIEDVVQNMGNIQVRRLPVVDRDKRLVGVISLADAVLKDDPATVGVALTGVVEPGGTHAT